MNKKAILIPLIIILALALTGGGYFYWKTQMNKSVAKQAVEKIQEATTTVTENVSKAVLPTIDTGAVNPLESAQSANPYEKTNPFSKIKVNPFE